MEKNSDCDRGEYSRLHDQHDARVVTGESHAGENCLDRIDQINIGDGTRNQRADRQAQAP